MKEFDIISIGGGSGGIATMNRAGEHGARAAVIEEKQLGGTCVNSVTNKPTTKRNTMRQSHVLMR